MLTNNLLKAINKTGLVVTKNQSRNSFFVQGPSRYGEFYDQDGHVVCLSTCWNNLKSDSMTDYFPQRWHDTIKSFITTIVEVRN